MAVECGKMLLHHLQVGVKPVKVEVFTGPHGSENPRYDTRLAQIWVQRLL